jgi:chemotaxis methyl-accepting protein methylase
LAVLENVELLAVSFPEEMPPGSWDLVVCSEVLYYLDRPALEDAIGYFEAQLSRSMTVLVVSWRGSAQTEPLTGDEVHDLLSERLARWHTFDGRKDSYRLDRFEGNAS